MSTVPSLLGARRNASGPVERLAIVVPGFGTGDLSTLPLRHDLRRLGYAAEGRDTTRKPGG